jgi:hypothetical protein
MHGDSRKQQGSDHGRRSGDGDLLGVEVNVRPPLLRLSNSARWAPVQAAKWKKANIRRAERREEGLLALNVQVTAIHASLDGVHRAAEKGQATSQYQYALQLLGELRQFWEGSSSGVIPDQSIIRAYIALDVAARESLPTGSLGAERQR